MERKPIALALAVDGDARDQRPLNPSGSPILDLAGPGPLMTAAAILEHQFADMHVAGPIENRFTDSKNRVLVAFTPQHVHRDVALRKQSVDHEPVSGPDR